MPSKVAIGLAPALTPTLALTPNPLLPYPKPEERGLSVLRLDSLLPAPRGEGRGDEGSCAGLRVSSWKHPSFP